MAKKPIISTFDKDRIANNRKGSMRLRDDGDTGATGFAHHRQHHRTSISVQVHDVKGFQSPLQIYRKIPKPKWTECARPPAEMYRIKVYDPHPLCSRFDCLPPHL